MKRIKTLIIIAIALMSFAANVASAPITIGVAAYCPLFGMMLFPDQKTAETIAPVVARSLAVTNCRFENIGLCLVQVHAIRYEPFIIDDGQ